MCYWCCKLSLLLYNPFWTQIRKLLEFAFCLTSLPWSKIDIKYTAGNKSLAKKKKSEKCAFKWCLASITTFIYECIPISNSKVQHSVQFSSVTQSCPTLCDPMNRSTPGLPAHHQLPESTQTHVHWVGDAIQPSHPLLSPSPPALNLSQHQGLFKWVSSSHQVAKLLEFQFQHQSFQWTPRTDLL